MNRCSNLMAPRAPDGRLTTSTTMSASPLRSVHATRHTHDIVCRARAREPRMNPDHPEDSPRLGAARLPYALSQRF